MEEERARRSKKKGGSSAHLAQRCLQGRSRLEQVVSQLRPPPERAPLRHLTPLPVSVRAVPAVSVLARLRPIMCAWLCMFRLCACACVRGNGWGGG